MHEETSSVDWEKSILSLLSSSEAQQVKKLRKQVLLSLQLPDDDKAAKKAFKKAVQGLETNGTVRLDVDGSITLIGKHKKDKKDKKDKKQKKRKLEKNDDDDVKEDDDGKKSKKKKSTEEKKHSTPEDDGQNRATDEEGKYNNDDDDDDDRNDVVDSNADAATAADKNKPCKGNPQGCTRLFLGNLPFAVDEASLASFLPGKVTHIKWITDKETGKFYGSAFCEMDNSRSAADAVAMAGEKLIGRSIKINFAPARDGDIWPPKDKVISGGGAGGSGAGGNNKNNSGQAGGSGVKAMTAKPDGCVKLFCGNLSYEIDDETITKFFASVDAELKAVRWIHHKDSGDFKGVGFAEFWNTEACEKAASLNGKNLLGRPIRLDWSD